MASLYLILALLVQCSHMYADIQPQRNETASVEILAETAENISHANTEDKFDKLKHKPVEEVSKEGNVITKPETDDLPIKDFRTVTNDWLGTFYETNADSYPSSSASLMARALNSNKTPEAQLEDIKEAASEMTLAFENEVDNLLSQVLTFVNEPESNNTRKKRSLETPVDCSQLVMKLLKHIKNNNECQNIAIDKMMSAQEIADKYGVEFNPDPEIIGDLALASSQHAKELSLILKDAFDQNTTSNATATTKIKNEINQPENNLSGDNSICYAFSNENPKCDIETNTNGTTTQGHVHIIPSKNTDHTSHVHYIDNHVGYNYYSYPSETQIAPPPVQYAYGPAVSPKPTFYDTISYNPNEYYLPYCSMDQMAYPPLFSFEDPLNLEPELVGEEYEETLSSRVIIEQDDEPGSATVNHIMTYTVSEKAHFKSPQIEKLPQQVQYYFYLM